MRKAASKLQHRMTPKPASTHVPAPLAGRRIVVTRARAQASDLVGRLTALGADVVCAPVIRIEPAADLAPLRRALAALSTYDWIVFTSANAVAIACAEPAAYRGAHVAAIGPATAAALEREGIAVELVPAQHVAEALAAALVARGVTGKRVLVPAAERARPVLSDTLRAAGAVVDVVAVYRTVAEAGDAATLARDLAAGGIDAVTFTASSTVEHFAALVGGAAATCGRFRAAVIGPVTAATARELGVAAGGLIEADPSTAEGLITALLRHFGTPA
jgi:uroporphyrinogen III methyltransferase/synthase